MKTNDIIKKLKIGIASPEKILEWSYGEVTKPETINYKSLKPERDGLFDEVIFGPTKNYECACGRYKKIKFKGYKCDRCDVEITESLVRRERMGHIKLETPIAHIWMTKELPNPSKISLLLNISFKEVEQVVYFINHIVLDIGNYTYENKPIFKHKEIIDIANPKNSQKTRTKLRRILKDIATKLKNDKDPVKKLDYMRAKTYDMALAEKNLPFTIKEVLRFISKYTGMEFGIGAEAIQKLLKKLDIKKEIENISNELLEYNNPNDINVKKLFRRLEVLKLIKESGNKPEWMVMNYIPVTPPDTRPIIQLDGGRFTTSDINSFYRKIIIRNERLKTIKKGYVPTILLDNECRMLQEAVDSLFDNQSRRKPVLSRDRRILKSLSSHLKGKQGLFRQNLLGKRVDYSGRSVIVVGPELKMYEVGIPSIMILKLFRPFIIRELISKVDEFGNEKQPYANTIKQAEKLILEQHKSIWNIIQKVIKERPVLLNRAPTLHRLGIQAFNVKLADGKAIRLHPLVTTAFNADFDGDQMAVHLPLSKEAVAEARSIMLASKNILGPKDGKSIVTPTQDIVLGNYFLTKEEKKLKGEGTIFNDVDEVLLSLANKSIDLHTLIGIKTSAFPKKEISKTKGILVTTAGKIIFNSSLPEEFIYVNKVKSNEIQNIDDIISYTTNIKEFIENKELNQPLGKKNLGLIVDKLYELYSKEISTVPECLDKMKELGFKYSTLSSTSVSLFDIPSYNKKQEYFEVADKKVIELQEFKDKGWITEDERYVKTVQIWNKVKDEVTKDIEEIVSKDLNKNNSIVVMAKSEARGNISNFTQLAGMRGLMSKSFNYDQKQKSKIIKDTIEIPIKHSFVEGLSISEYFNSTYGARKGLTDTAMKTSKSGYMTRKLVDATQEVIISEHDCKTNIGLEVSDLYNTLDQSIIEPMYDRIFGRFSAQDVYSKDNVLIVKKDNLITKRIAKQIVDSGNKSVLVRSPLNCQSTKGICQKCFGIDLSTNDEIKIGTAIGVIAAQSIGEPGTQLTMRTFHTGGVSGEGNITQGFERLKQLFEIMPPKKFEKAIISEVDGKVTNIFDNGIKKTVTILTNKEEVNVNIPENSKLRVKLNDEIKLGSKITEGLINLDELLEIVGINGVRNYLIKEVQKVYRLQGIEISDKYIEIIVNQLTNKAIIVNPGDTEYFVGQIVNINKIKEISQQFIKENKKMPIILPRIYGLESIPSKSDSFLSAASFQDTKKILTDAATKGQVDKLFGLKENIIIGKLIPVGTGILSKEEILEDGDLMLSKEY